MATFQKENRENKENKDMVYGLHPVMEALESNKEINKLMVQRGLRGEQSSALLDLAKSKEIAIQLVPLEKLNRLTRKNHQGVIAFTSPIVYHPLDELIQRVFEAGRNPLFVALDRVTDTRNLGAIARTAECAGVDGLILPEKNSALVTSDAIRTSTGALLRLPVCKVAGLSRSLSYLQQSGLQVVACTEKADQDMYVVPFDLPTVIVMGSEEDGISNDVMRMADHLAAIPLMGKIGSLNVSVAAGIVLYELGRQRMAKV